MDTWGMSSLLASVQLLTCLLNACLDCNVVYDGCYGSGTFLFVCFCLSAFDVDVSVCTVLYHRLRHRKMLMSSKKQFLEDINVDVVENKI